MTAIEKTVGKEEKEENDNKINIESLDIENPEDLEDLLQEFRRSCSKNDIDTMKKILKKKFKPNAKFDIEFANAAKKGNIKIIKLLLNDNRINPIAFNNMAFRLAVENKRGVVIELLSENEKIKQYKQCFIFL